MNKNSRSIFVRMVFGLTLVILYLPMLVLVISSFSSTRSFFSGFSLQWYLKLFTDSPLLWETFRRSFWIAISSAVLATIIGTMGAIGWARYSFRLKKALGMGIFLPMLLPEIILGVAMLIFFTKLKLTMGVFTIFIAHTTFCMPYVFMLVLARLDEFDRHILEAAYDLGAGEWQMYVRVLLPLCAPAIIAALLLSLTLSFDDFVITFFVSGPGSSTLPLYIYSMIRFGVSPVVNALSVMMLLGSVLLAGVSLTFYDKIFVKK